jgi:hypothetical protein
MDVTRPSLVRILSTDYASSLSVLFVIGTWGAYLFIRFVRNSPDAPSFMVAAAAVTVLAAAALAWRVRLIQSVFEDGWQVQGSLVSVSFFRDRGRVTYVYTVQGQRYQSSNAVMRNRLTRGLAQGRNVTIVAGKDNPKDAFIRELYL